MRRLLTQALWFGLLVAGAAPAAAFASTIVLPQSCTPGVTVCPTGTTCQQYASNSNTGTSFYCVSPQQDAAPATYINNTSSGNSGGTTGNSSIASPVGRACSATQSCPSGYACDSFTNTCTLRIPITHAYGIQSTGGAPCSNGSTGLCNPLKVQSIQGLLTTILSFVTQIGTVVVVLMLVVTGFKFVIARGNPGELEKARTMLVWTLIGALILLGAQAIAAGISATVTSISAGP
ncbi:MAG: hypothetical protein B7X04_03590 [Parcubacteria group bacterium 21-54-25]|nr:MAG: hypothetical protein B7X04_03590 [Parcubacteria group bacterium 21-54-25]HQU08069.1 TrbC/VirB2 family protein [Candidatus Paceibacterota bacterium]